LNRWTLWRAHRLCSSAGSSLWRTVNKSGVLDVVEAVVCPEAREQVGLTHLRWLFYSDTHHNPEPVMLKVNLFEKLAQFSDQWKPRVVGELNGQMVKLVKFQGPFVWHHHDHEDELFLVVKGRFRMEFRDRHVWLEEGEFLIVSRGVEHRPVAEQEAHVLLFEPASTLNTGNVQNERTVAHPDRI
jgi:mannose-6-phosphate isomerase-like protein (cupin superfamily)